MNTDELIEKLRQARAGLTAIDRTNEHEQEPGYERAVAEQRAELEALRRRAGFTVIAGSQ
jgi:hypothetical protein